MAAELQILKKPNGTWCLPSQTSKGNRYTIKMGNCPRCSCAYLKTHHTNCKQIFAFEYFLQREQYEAGSETVTEHLTLRPSPERHPLRTSPLTTPLSGGVEIVIEFVDGTSRRTQQKTPTPRKPLFPSAGTSIQDNCQRRCEQLHWRPPLATLCESCRNAWDGQPRLRASSETYVPPGFLFDIPSYFISSQI